MIIGKQSVALKCLEGKDLLVGMKEVNSLNYIAFERPYAINICQLFRESFED